MKYKCINGWTKERMIEAIQTRMLDHPSYNTIPNFCVYKALDGNRCAIGVFIPDGHSGEYCNLSVSGLLQSYPDLTDLMPLPTYALITMQSVHDSVDRNLGKLDPRPVIINWINENVE